MGKIIGLLLVISLWNACAATGGGRAVDTPPRREAKTGGQAAPDAPGAMTKKAKAPTMIELRHVRCENPNVPQAKRPPAPPQIEIGVGRAIEGFEAADEGAVYAAGGCPP